MAISCKQEYYSMSGDILQLAGGPQVVFTKDYAIHIEAGNRTLGSGDIGKQLDFPRPFTYNLIEQAIRKT